MPKYPNYITTFWMNGTKQAMSGKSLQLVCDSHPPYVAKSQAEGILDT